MVHHNPEDYIKKDQKSIARRNIHKDHPRHAFAIIMIISNNIRGQNACQQLKECRIQPKNGKEEYNGRKEVLLTALRKANFNQ